MNASQSKIQHIYKTKCQTLLRPLRRIVRAHKRISLMISKEAEDILRKIFQPGDNLAVRKRERILMMERVHVDVVGSNHHPIIRIHRWMKVRTAGVHMSTASVGCCYWRYGVVVGGLWVHLGRWEIGK